MKFNQKILAVTVLTLASLTVHAHGALNPKLWAREPGVPDACASQPLVEYNMNLHIISLFVILGTSFLGVFSPMLLDRLKAGSDGISGTILTIAKFFGTGVILATAFIHMLPDAFSRFANPCLTGIWSDYGAWAGAFCMLSALTIQLIEFAAISNVDRLKARATSGGYLALTEDKVPDDERALRFNHHDHDHGDDSETSGHVHAHAHSASLEDGFKDIGTLILEIGITLHSFIIGITLSNAGDAEFVKLLIALVFHQFFEGVALGTRINELKNSPFLHPFILGLIYALTTPSGIAIGIGIRSSYNSNSTTAVLTVGILDSLSAGILLYNVFVELISMEMNQNTSFRRKPLWNKSMCFASMYIGAFITSLLGIWV